MFSRDKWIHSWMLTDYLHNFLDAGIYFNEWGFLQDVCILFLGLEELFCYELAFFSDFVKRIRCYVMNTRVPPLITLSNNLDYYVVNWSSVLYYRFKHALLSWLEHEICYYMLTFSRKLQILCNVALFLCEEHKRIW